MLPTNLLPDEDVADLGIRQLKVLQKKAGFRFSIDAVLLAHFIQPDTAQRACWIWEQGQPLFRCFWQLVIHIYRLTVSNYSREIAQMAQRSVQHNGLETQIHILQQDLTQMPSQYYQQYDWVVSNPPFFPLGSSKQSPNRKSPWRATKWPARWSN